MAGSVLFAILLTWLVIKDSKPADLFVTEDQCEAKLAADKMPGTVPDCNNIERVKMDQRIAVELLTSMGISHAGLEGTLWDCKLNSDKAGANASKQRCFHRQKYWNDEAAYSLSPSAAATLHAATEELHAMCLQAVDAVVESDDLMTLFEIPPNMREAVRESWRKRETDFLGRFDLMWDGRGPPKLAEYNADTPTILVETGLGQEIWFRNKMSASVGSRWQFNNIEKNLIKAWKKLASSEEQVYLAGPLSSVEEKEHLQYLKKMAIEAGIKAQVIDISHVDIMNEHLFHNNVLGHEDYVETKSSNDGSTADHDQIKKLFKKRLTFT